MKQKAIELAEINKTTRKLIKEYISCRGITLNHFAKESKTHQNQLWLYLYSDSDKGLHSGTLERIGKYIAENT